MEIFVNGAFATLASGIDDVTTTLPLTTGQGVRFGTIPNGDKIRIAFLDASLNISEVAYITAITVDTATIVRGQDGTAGVIHLAGDRIEARIGKSTLDSLTQKASAGTDAIAEMHAATSKATPADADEVGIWDSVSGLLNKLTLANLKAAVQFPSGTRMPFNQSAAPIGWTKDVTAALNDTAMRIVTGAIGSGGVVDFSAATYTPTITPTVGSLAVDSHVLTIAEMPSHTHDFAALIQTGGSYVAFSNTGGQKTGTTTATGGDGGHSHTLSGAPAATSSAITLGLKYNDFIIATKD